MQDSIWPRDQLGIEYELMAEHGPGDAELNLVRRELEELDPDGDRFAAVLRDTLDQLLDGRRRGRFDYRDLYKTEKTYMGTLVEINLQRAFDFEDGDGRPSRWNTLRALRVLDWFAPPAAQ